MLSKDFPTEKNRSVVHFCKKKKYFWHILLAIIEDKGMTKRLQFEKNCTNPLKKYVIAMTAMLYVDVLYSISKISKIQVV